MPPVPARGQIPEVQIKTGQCEEYGQHRGLEICKNPVPDLFLFRGQVHHRDAEKKTGQEIGQAQEIGRSRGQEQGDDR